MLCCEFSLIIMITSILASANFVSDSVIWTHTWVVLFIFAIWNFILTIFFLSIFFITIAWCRSVMLRLIFLSSACLNNNFLAIESWFILLIFCKRLSIKTMSFSSSSTEDEGYSLSVEFCACTLNILELFYSLSNF